MVIFKFTTKVRVLVKHLQVYAKVFLKSALDTDNFHILKLQFQSQHSGQISHGQSCQLFCTLNWMASIHKHLAVLQYCNFATNPAGWDSQGFIGILPFAPQHLLRCFLQVQELIRSLTEVRACKESLKRAWLLYDVAGYDDFCNFHVNYYKQAHHFYF